MSHSLGIRTTVLSRTVPRSIYPQTLVFAPIPYRQSQQQCRSFSQSPASNLKGGIMTAPTTKAKIPAEMSWRSRTRELKPEDIPTDFGVLPGTFVRPEGDGLPSLFKEPRDRLRMEWVWLKTWFQSVIATVQYHKWTVKPALPLDIRQRKKIAKELHQKMYTEFARGNEQYIRANCSPGLAKTLVNRIKKRDPLEMVSWTLEKYNRTPSTFFTGVRILSDRATAIPDFPDSGIRQVVVRISSQQRMQTSTKDFDEKGGIFPGPHKIQDCTEYMVMQKVRIQGVQRDWEIWGFTKPTTVEDLESPFFAPGISLKERMEAMQDLMAGKR